MPLRWLYIGFSTRSASLIQFKIVQLVRADPTFRSSLFPKSDGSIFLKLTCHNLFNMPVIFQISHRPAQFSVGYFVACLPRPTSGITTHASSKTTHTLLLGPSTLVVSWLSSFSLLLWTERVDRLIHFHHGGETIRREISIGVPSRSRDNGLKTSPKQRHMEGDQHTKFAGHRYFFSIPSSIS